MHKRKIAVELDRISKYSAEITVKDEFAGDVVKVVHVSSSPLDMLLGRDMHTRIEKAVAELYLELNDWEELDYVGETWSEYDFTFLKE